MISIEKLVYSFKKELEDKKFNFDSEQNNIRHIKEYYFHIMERKVGINDEYELETAIYKMTKFYIDNAIDLIKIIKSKNQSNSGDMNIVINKTRVIKDIAYKIINNEIDDVYKSDIKMLYQIEGERIWQIIKDNSIITDQCENSVNVEYELYVYVICLLEK